MSFIKLENEEALEALADMLEPAAAICADQTLQFMVRSNKPMLSIATTILRKHPKEVVAIMAASECVPVDEYKINPIGLIKKLMELLNDKEMQDFFILQAQTAAPMSFGEPTENTEEKEQ